MISHFIMCYQKRSRQELTWYWASRFQLLKELQFNVSTFNEFADLLSSDGEEHIIIATKVYWQCEFLITDDNIQFGGRTSKRHDVKVHILYKAYFK